MANIFYGISGDISRKISKWISVAGDPDVFSEKDENLHKYKTALIGKYDVVSLDEALERYPDADIWVTYPRAGITAKYLLTKLPPERIHFLEADIEYRKGCDYLGRFISYRKDTFSPCCVTGECPVIRTSGSIMERLTQWQEYTSKLVDDIRQEKPNDCQNCHLLRFGPWRKTVGLNEINFGSNQPGDVCNFRCTYCFCEKTFKRLKDATDGFTTYEVMRQLSERPEYDTDDFIVQLANGEFCANKYCDEMLDILLRKKWKVELLSNMSIYNEKLATLMDSGRVRSLMTSLDAGTRETFMKIKRVDMFDRVIENLKKYPVDKTQLLLKYIMLDGVNDNEEDIDGFFDIAMSVGGAISLSSNLSAPYTDNMREMASRIIMKAKTAGIKVGTNSSYLTTADTKFIKEQSLI